MCVVIPFILDVRLVDAPAGVTQEGGQSYDITNLVEHNVNRLSVGTALACRIGGCYQSLAVQATAARTAIGVGVAVKFVALPEGREGLLVLFSCAVHVLLFCNSTMEF